jgi:hypothetical protein
MITFKAPTSGGGDHLAIADVKDHFVLVHVNEYIPEMTTANGVSDAVNISVADLTTGEHHLNVLWFANVIVGSLKRQVGDFVLAKVAQGVAKPGKNAPWILEDATGNAEVSAAAQKWAAANPGVLTGTPITAPAATAAPTGLAASLL